MPGGHAEHLLALADTTVLLPDGLDYELAAPVFCAGYTTRSGLRLAEPEPHERVAVLGIGGLGHMAVQFARALRSGMDIRMLHPVNPESATRSQTPVTYSPKKAPWLARALFPATAHVVGRQDNWAVRRQNEAYLGPHRGRDLSSASARPGCATVRSTPTSSPGSRPGTSPTSRMVVPAVTPAPTLVSEVSPTSGDPVPPPISPLAELLRTYSYAYTAAHDFGVSDRIMVDGYVLRMGTHTIRGRNEEYQPATRRQYRQFPALGFTVHTFVGNGKRAALHFTEHGRSVRTGGLASWQGVSLYRWDGERLTECRVEHDYYARRWQLDRGIPNPVLPPGIDPWSGGDVPADLKAAGRVRDWLESGRWTTDPSPAWDDGTARPRLAGAGTEVLDLFSAGSQVAFHVRLAGVYAGGLPGTDDLAGITAELYVTGIVDAADFAGTLISDRHGLVRRLRGGG